RTELEREHAVLYCSAGHNGARRVLDRDRYAWRSRENRVHIDGVGGAGERELRTDDRRQHTAEQVGRVGHRRGHATRVTVVDREAVDVDHIARRNTAVVEHIDAQHVRASGHIYVNWHAKIQVHPTGRG